MTPLFITDLDGTILDENANLPLKTQDALNALIESGAHITFATARSRESAANILRGVNYRIPLIVYNGAECFYHGKSFNAVTFSRAEIELFKRLFLGRHFLSFDFAGEYVLVKYKSGDCPVNSYAFNKMTQDGKKFIEVTNYDDFFTDDCFHILAIEDTREPLEPILNELREATQVGLFKDFYLKNYWLEIMPKESGKGRAALSLLAECGADYIVSFGDGYNDIPLFNVSRESYAVHNADKELIDIATAVLPKDVSVTDKIAEILRAL